MNGMNTNPLVGLVVLILVALFIWWALRTIFAPDREEARGQPPEYEPAYLEPQPTDPYADYREAVPEPPAPVFTETEVVELDVPQVPATEWDAPEYEYLDLNQVEALTGVPDASSYQGIVTAYNVTNDLGYHVENPVSVERDE